MNTQDWNEIRLSEDPAVELLETLGYTFVPSEQLGGERGSPKDVVLVPRLERKLRELNPWLSEENLRKAVRAVTNVPAADLVEANRKVHTSLVHNISLEQDIGDLPAPRKGGFFVYVMKCSNDSFYIGQTDDIERRFREHEQGRISWTAARKPLWIIHWEIFDTRKAAIKREQDLKTGYGRKWLKREYASGRLARQAGGQGKKGHDVHYIDFDNPQKNEFIVTRQLRVAGSKEHIECDVVVFVNGIPLVVIECKSPTIREPIDKAIKQLLRYQEQKDEYRHRGAPKLFETVQIVIATCGEKAKFGTVGTPFRHFLEWKVPHPITTEELNVKYTSRIFEREPTPQDLLIYGLLHPANLLDLVRNFVAFEVESGRIVKKMARYQQFIAVNYAMKRIQKAKNPTKRGGVIWHTQGSGKSLSMLWLAVKLRRCPDLENPILVIVTDRIDLDDQIVGTFDRCGFPDPIQAKSVANLRKSIRLGNGQTVMTTVQKFQELSEDKGHPVLSDAENVFVMVDEAHRTQYRSLAANMRQALPNACFLGFTGTPIDKKDRSTRETFGSYIHTYTIEQAVRDKATVPIYYESRLPNVHIHGQNLDALFDRYFKDYDQKQREEIKRKYGTEEVIALASTRIEAICLDIIEHYEKSIMPNGFKAQIVTLSREAAVSYKETFDRLGAPPSAVLISGGYNDPERLARHHKSKSVEKEIIRSFKEDPVDKIAIIIVCDKLLTGFDAPVEQVMYIDCPLREHTLLQAIARVNRRPEKKDYGLVVDYWGLSEDLQTALGIFSSADIAEALVPKTDELPRLEVRHRVAVRFFNLPTESGKVDKSDLESCLKVLEPEDVRADFDIAFKRFSQSMDMVLPDPAALRYSADLKWLGKIRNAARVRFRDTSLDLSACGAKVRQLIEEHLKTNGVQKLIEPVPVLSREFDEAVARLTTTDAKASEIEHAVRHEINVRLEEDPVFYESLRERLEKIIEAKRQRRMDAAETLKRLQSLVGEIRGVGEKAQDLGFSETEYALYKILTPDAVTSETDVKKGYVVEEPTVPYGVDKGKELTRSIIESLQELAVIDWIHKEDVQREMRRRIRRILRQKGYHADEVQSLTIRIMDLARVRLTR